MQRRLLLVFSACVFFTALASAQNNEWVWMNGDTAMNQAPTWGTLGVAAATNYPGVRYESAEWKDKNGNFWIYGGFLGSAGAAYSDLWKYNPVTNLWTWVQGSNASAVTPVWGTQGVPAAANTPGARYLACYSWVDNNGNFWLFGGAAGSGTDCQAYNDMWMYNPVTNQWTWMNGSGNVPATGPPYCSPVFGTQGVAAPGNTPGGRFEGDAAVTDKNGNLWLFAGQGIDVSGNWWEWLNDLWKYNVATNQWTWMGGSQTGNQNGNYGALGIAAAANWPGSRQVHNSWLDSQGNIWVWGEQGYAATGGTGFLNDVWKYNIASGLWTWMSGPNTSSSTAKIGTYGTKCISSASNIPTTRYETRARWMDECNNLWVFGGEYYSANNQVFNDLWMYNTKTSFWTWISGSNNPNQQPVYGTVLVPSPTTMPGSMMGANAFYVKGQGMWLIGGENTFQISTGLFTYVENLHFNVWKYIPDKPTAAFTSAVNSGCSALTANFTDNSVPNCNAIKSWLWNFGDPSTGTADTSSQTNPSHTFSAAGTYSVKLVVHNCTLGADSITKSVTVTAGTVFSALATSTPQTCSSKGTATVSLTGGTASFTYSWSPSGGNAATATNLNGGNYTIAVTDANNCTATATVTVANNSAVINITTQAIFATCGQNNGSVAVTSVSGGSPAYTYSWSPIGSSAQTVNGLGAGSFTVTVTDKNGCTQTSAETITATGSTISVTPSVIQNVCGSNPGEAQAGFPSGGTGPYSYSWSNGLTGNNSTAFFDNNLTAATYTLYITDASGCTGTGTVTIAGPVATTTSSVAATCTTGGTATAVGSGGVGPYTYSWNPGSQPTATATGLTGGTYTVYVSDSYDCVTTQAVTVGSSGAAFTLSASSNPAGCSGTNGSATVTATGGSGGPTYSWNNTQTTQTATNLSPATYTVTVTEGGCSSTTAVIVTQTGVGFTLSTSSNPATCAGTGGNAKVTVTGGVSPTYSWSNTQTTQTATNLTPGIYTVTVTDGGCSSASTVDVTQSAVTFTLSPTENPANCAGTGGSAQVTVTGGVSPTYSWNNAQTTQTATNLGPGTYTVTVTDGGCSSTTTITVTQSGITFSLGATENPANCAGTGGSAQVIVTGGVSPTYSWNNTKTTQTVNNLGPGTYTVTVTDGGCSSSTTITVTQATIDFTLSATSKPVNCAGKGSATVNATGATGPTYTWSNLQTAQTANNLTAGNYTVTVTDVNGCEASVSVTVNDSSVISAVAGPDTSICLGNKVQLNGSGAGSFSWSPGKTLSDSTIANPLALPLMTTNYILTVKSGPCSGSDTVNVIVIPALLPSITRDTVIVSGQSVQLSAGGGSNYLWTPSDGLSDTTQANTTASPLTTKTYIVLVSDAKGCAAIDSVTVTVLDKSFCGRESIYVPSAFSPNGDGENDVLYVRSLCLYSLEFRVFDRWGELVFHTENAEVGWDGTLRGVHMDMAVFHYTLEAQTITGVKISKKGNITLMR